MDFASRLPCFLQDDRRRPRLLRALVELLAFAWHEAWSCLFPVFIFACLGLTKQVAIPGIPRYDLLLALCLLFQAWMLWSGRETRDELKVVCLFHALGLAMELWKVRNGSWSYPGEAWTKIGGVPLFSGFMYASVASYACQAWRRLRLRLHRWPGSRGSSSGSPSRSRPSSAPGATRTSTSAGNPSISRN